MKYLVLIITFFVVTNVFSQQFQNRFDTKINYRLTFRPDSNNKEHIKEEYFELLINGDSSLFRSVNKGKNDSTDYAEAEKNKQINTSGGEYEYKRPIKTNFAYDIFFVKDMLLHYETFQDGIKYFYKENIHPVQSQWELTSEIQTLYGYNCQMASLDYGGRKWIAWFAAAIPLKEGPYKFKGLPGLIVKLEDIGKNWSFELLSVNRGKYNSAVAEVSKDKVLEVNKKKFYETKKYLLDNWLDISKLNSKVKYSSKDIENKERKDYQDKIKGDNNWIELYP